MKLNLIILGISILAAYGCSPQSPQPTEQTGSNASSALPPMLLRNDLPKCDSNDTREIISEIYRNDTKLPFFKSSFCYLSHSNNYFYLGTPDPTNSCDSLKAAAVEELEKRVTYINTHNRWQDIRAAGFYEALGERNRLARAKIYTVSGIETKFISFLVKQEEIAPDGNSNNCIVSYEIESSSKDGYQEFDKKPNLSLRIYKPNSNGKREYDFSWE